MTTTLFLNRDVDASVSIAATSRSANPVRAFIQTCRKVAPAYSAVPPERLKPTPVQDWTALVLGGALIQGVTA